MNIKWLVKVQSLNDVYSVTESVLTLSCLHLTACDAIEKMLSKSTTININ